MSGSTKLDKKSEDNSISVEIEGDEKIRKETQYKIKSKFSEYTENIIRYILESERYTIDDGGNIGIDISDVDAFKNDNMNHISYQLVEFTLNSRRHMFGSILSDFTDRFDKVTYDNVVYIEDFDGEDIEFVEFSNISSEHTNTEHGFDDKGDFIRTEVQVQDLADVKIANLDSVWKCQKNHYNKKYHSRWQNKLQPPASCGGYPTLNQDEEEAENCNCRPTSREPNSSECKIDIRRLVLSEIDKDDRESRTLIGDVGKAHLNSVSRRDKLEILAEVQMADRQNNSQSEPYLNIVGLKKHNQSVNLSDEDIDDLEQLVDAYEDDELIDDLAESVAPHILDKDGQKQAKLAVLLSAVRGAGYTERDTIHVLEYGKYGSGKSDIMEFLHEILNDSQYADTQNASTSGLTATTSRSGKLDSDGDNWIITSGSVPQADQSVACIDELDKTDIDESVLGQPMSKGKVIISKAGSATLQARTSIVATANPLDGQYDYESESKLTTLDISKHIQDRFDLIIRVDDKIETEDKEEEMLSQMSLSDSDGSNEDDDPEFSKEDLREYIAYAKQQDVEWSEEADELVQERILNMRMTFKNISNPDLQVSNRELRKFQRICSAMTKLRLGDTVQKQDVERAWDLFKYGWQSVTNDVDIE